MLEIICDFSFVKLMSLVHLLENTVKWSELFELMQMYTDRVSERNTHRETRRAGELSCVCGWRSKWTVNMDNYCFEHWWGIDERQPILNLIFQMNADYSFEADFNDLLFSLAPSLPLVRPLFRHFSIPPTRGNLYRFALITFDFMRNFQLNKSNEQTDWEKKHAHTHKKKSKGKKNKKKPYIKTIRNEFEWKQIAFDVYCIDCVMQVWHKHTYIPSNRNEKKSMKKTKHKVDSDTFLKTISFSFAYQPVHKSE